MGEKEVLDLVIKALTSYRATLEKPATPPVATPVVPPLVRRVPRRYKRLSDKQKADILYKWEAYEATQVQLSRDYGVSPTTISRIIYGSR